MGKSVFSLSKGPNTYKNYQKNFVTHAVEPFIYVSVRRKVVAAGIISINKFWALSLSRLQKHFKRGAKVRMLDRQNERNSN